MSQRRKQAAAAAAAAERHLNMAQNKILYQDWDAAMEQCLKARNLCSSFSLCDQTFAIIKVRQNAKLKINGQHDWYAVLLIEDHLCHEKFIKISYDYLSKILDPEQNKVRGAKAAFDCVNQAFQVLSNPRKRAFYDETIRNPAEANKITAAQPEIQENRSGKNGIGSSGEIKNHAQQEIEEENPGGSAEMNHAQQQSQEREAGFKSSAELISAQEKIQEKANGKSWAGVAEEEIASGSKQSSGSVSENSSVSELDFGDFCPWQEKAFRVLSNPRKRAFYDETIRNSAEANKITAAQPEIQENRSGKNGIGSSGEIKNHAQQEIEEENPGGSAEMNHAQQQSQGREAGFKSSAELIGAQEKIQEKANGKSWAGVAEEEIASGSKQSSGFVSENSSVSELDFGDFCPWQEKDAPTFWTACNHCHEQYEYERVHENKTMGCWNCRNTFVAVPAFKVPLKLFERISPESVGYSESECAILYENIMDAKLGKGTVNKDEASGSRKRPKK